jgi:hypothetical protein
VGKVVTGSNGKTNNGAGLAAAILNNSPPDIAEKVSPKMIVKANVVLFIGTNYSDIGIDKSVLVKIS